MRIDSIKHNIKWNSRIGDASRSTMTWLGLRLLKLGRRSLKWSLGRCSWCGANCGFSSRVSKKGLRCSSLHRNCENETDV